MSERKYTKRAASAEQHAFLRECFDKHLEYHESSNLLKEKFGKASVSNSSLFGWWKKFKAQNFSLNPSGRSRSSSITSSDSETMEVDTQSTSAQKRKIDDRKAAIATTSSTSLVPYPITPAEFKSPFAKEGKFSFDMTTALPAEKVDPSNDKGAGESQIEYHADDYSTMDPEYPVLGSMSQDLANALDIDFHNMVTDQPRSLKTGRFETKDNCVLCNLPIDDMFGYGQLACKHKVHWDQPYFDWIRSGEIRGDTCKADEWDRNAFKRCPKNSCKKHGRFPNCDECKEKVGADNWETACYCKPNTNIHADALEMKLRANGGRCDNCLQPHPGFCQICHRLRWLGYPIKDKIYRHCCNSFADKHCWDEAEEKICPYGCSNYGPVTVLDYIPICGVQNPPKIDLPFPRGLIGGQSSGCSKLKELNSKLWTINAKDTACVVCKQSKIPRVFNTHFQCGHWIHYKYDCFTKWLPVSDTEGLWWYMKGTKIQIACRPWQAFSPCPKCAFPKNYFDEQTTCGRPILPTKEPCSYSYCKNWLWSGFKELQMTCCTKLCSECHKTMLLANKGFCQRGHLGRNFCLLCGDFIAVMGEGDSEHNPEKDLMMFKQNGKEDWQQFTLMFIKRYCRLLFAREEFVSLSCCRRPFHTKHLSDWFTRFGRFCPGCGADCPAFENQILNRHVNLSTTKLPLIKGEQNITFNNKKYPLFDDSEPCLGYCFFCHNIIGYKATAVRLKCCNIDFHLQHLDNWSKRVGQICPNCGRSFGKKKEMPIWFLNKDADMGVNGDLIPRFEKGAVVQCCKSLVPHHALEEACYCWCCEVDLDEVTLLPLPGQTKSVRCSYCGCAMSKTDPIFLDCGHVLHYYCLLTWIFWPQNVFGELDYQINKDPNAIIHSFEHEDPDITELLIPRYYDCVKCGFKQRMHHVFPYLDQKLTDWETAEAIVKYRGSHAERLKIVPLQLTEEQAKKRKVCRLCAGDINEENPSTNSCPKCLQCVHNKCVAIWKKTTTCERCTEQCIPYIACEQKTTHADLTPQHAKIRHEPIIDNGDCFYCACAVGFHGRAISVKENGVNLRKWTYFFLEQLAFQHLIYPKSTYSDRASFWTTITYALLDNPDIETIQQYCTKMAVPYEEIGPDGKKGVWAQMNDAYIVSMYLQRVIVIIRVEGTQAELSAMQVPPKWTSKNVQQRKMPLLLEVFFPDALHLSMPFTPSTSWENLEHFTMSGTMPNGQETTRNIDHPILLFYNGVTHYDAILFSNIERSDPAKLRTFDATPIQMDNYFQ